MSTEATSVAVVPLSTVAESSLPRINPNGRIRPARKKRPSGHVDSVIVTPCGSPWPRPYYFENGLRRVNPYHFTYNTNAKGRWRNRPLLEIFSEEFRDRSFDYYKHAIETGNICINGKEVPTDAIVQNGDVISHTIHRHEPPVTPDPVGIVHEDEDIIVINKPAGVPVHPAGRYNFNSVIEIVRDQRGYQFNPLPCNRLDRLTSGIMFLGKHSRGAEAMCFQIKERTVMKEYVARVAGEFPEGEIICEKPILQISPKLGLNAVRANGRTARTVFKRLAYYPPKDLIEETEASSEPNNKGKADDGTPWKRLQGYSIVRCAPLTGRTHQIRVHLQFLGHPISNDPIYSNQRVFGPSLAQGSADSDNDDDIITRLSKMGKEEVADAIAYHDEMVDQYQAKKAEKMTGAKCEVCETPLYSDPGPHELGIYLHARKYACMTGKWAYETPLPAWALPPSGYDGPVDVTPESDPMNIDLAKLTITDEDAEATDAPIAAVVE